MSEGNRDSIYMLVDKNSGARTVVFGLPVKRLDPETVERVVSTKAHGEVSPADLLYNPKFELNGQARHLTQREMGVIDENCKDIDYRRRSSIMNEESVEGASPTPELAE